MAASLLCIASALVAACEKFQALELDPSAVGGAGPAGGRGATETRNPPGASTPEARGGVGGVGGQEGVDDAMARGTAMGGMISEDESGTGGSGGSSGAGLSGAGMGGGPTAAATGGAAAGVGGASGNASSNAGTGGLSSVCDKCDSAHSTLKSCSEQAGCVYSSCGKGYLDCSTSFPNVDGCSCRGNACCGSKCQTAHSNGVGNTFYDCVAIKTYTAEQAFKAADADTQHVGVAQAQTCGAGSDQLLGVCKTTLAGVCACWTYLGTGIYSGMTGRVTVQTNGCVCGTASAMTWN